MVVGVIAIGQTLIILTAGIDLSCGMVMALGGIVMTKFAAELGLPAPLAILCGMAVTALFGLLNGLLVTRIKLPPFIVTLGTLNIAFAITQLYSNSQTVTDLPPLMTWLGNTFAVGGTEVGYGAVLMLVLYLAWFWLRETAAGRHVYAVGNNPRPRAWWASPPTACCWACTCWPACSTASPSLLSVARTGVGDPNAGQTENLDAITAVVLGGTSLFGGRGVILGTPGGRGGRGRAAQRPHADGRVVGLPGADHRHPGDPGGGGGPAVTQGSALMTQANPKLVMQATGLVKRYGQVTALDGADFELRAGEILAVIGDNGAGKSSLIKCLSGATIPDEGEILLDGKPVHFKSPIDARHAGIETVYQDLAVAPAMTIAENLFLGRELRRPGFLGNVLRMLDKKKMLEKASPA
jgi:fructose transport system permease protein